MAFTFRGNWYSAQIGHLDPLANGREFAGVRSSTSGVSTLRIAWLGPLTAAMWTRI